jgi:TPR repeat protein
VAQDYAEAARLYRPAAAQGYANAAQHSQPRLPLPRGHGRGARLRRGRAAVAAGSCVGPRRRAVHPWPPLPRGRGRRAGLRGGGAAHCTGWRRRRRATPARSSTPAAATSLARAWRRT